MLEEVAGTRVPPEVRATIFTLGQLIDAVQVAPKSDALSSDATDPDGRNDWARLLSTSAGADLVRDLERPTLARAIGFFLLLRLGALVRLVIRLRVEGREHLPARGPYIIAPNHQAYLDAFVLAFVLPFGVLRQIFFVGAAEYFETPFMKRLARAANIVPVDPDANLVTAMQAAAAGLRLNKVLVLFPEGERSIDGTLKPFRKGAAILASHLEVPAVPVALDGLYELWPRGRAFAWRRLRPWRRQTVRVRIGRPLVLGRMDYVAATDVLQDAVRRLLAGEA
jgi:long-chain acyl-CoA synthetase